MAKTLINRIVAVGMLLFLVFGLWPACLPGHDQAFTDEHLVRGDAADLAGTTVSAHTEVPIVAGENVIWSGSFQLAWNELIDLLGEPVKFNQDSAMVAALNKQLFTASDVDEAAYIAVADFVGNDVFGQIDRALFLKFLGAARPQYKPDPALTPRPQDIVVYSYLFKNLRFAKRFEELDEPLSFEGQPVACFGVERYKPHQEAIRSQVKILSYADEDDFVIELTSKSADDQIILAKVAPGATLEETIQAVLPAAAGPGEVMGYADVLMAPKINFDIRRPYDEIMGLNLRTSNPDVAKDLLVLSAVQGIRFQLDEKGVRLRDESYISLGCSASSPPVPEHLLIFDKPFLIMLKQTQADRPYFAMWVGNTELLAPLAAEE